MDTRLYVPYSEKESAKSAGALWDKINRTWYLPENCCRSKYRRWLGIEDEESICLFSESLSLAWSWESCWKCDNPSPVLMFVAKDSAKTISYDDDSDSYYDSDIPGNALISHTLFTDPSINEMISQYFPFFHKDGSRKAGKSYIMNHCLCCGAKLGDNYMITEPDDPFNPDPEADPLLVFIDLPSPELYYYNITGIENYTGIDEFVNERTVGWPEFIKAWESWFCANKKPANPFAEIKMWVELFYGLGKCGVP